MGVSKEDVDEDGSVESCLGLVPQLIPYRLSSNKVILGIAPNGIIVLPVLARVLEMLDLISSVKSAAPRSVFPYSTSVRANF